MKYMLTVIVGLIFSLGLKAQKGYAVIQTYSLGDTVTISVNKSYFKFNRNYYQLISQRTAEINNLSTTNKYIIIDREGNPVESGSGTINKNQDSFYKRMVQDGRQVGKRKYKKLSKSWPSVANPLNPNQGGMGPK